MIRCIAIDDEPIALNIIHSYCEKWGDISLETYSSPRIGMKRILEWRPDIVFLDIEMNGTSGIELARQLPRSCCLIFTTAYANYALEGFEVDAVDFLHKPYFYERFCRAMQKAVQWLKMHDLLLISESSSRKLVLKADYKNVTIPFGTIVYIESIDNYIRVHLTDGTSLVTKMALYSIEQQLPKDEFIRIHRSYLVASKRITAFTRSEVTLSGIENKLPVGKTYSEEVMKTIGG
ncbi:MAG: LytTR family DNA-binding domain-containing protein [Bacteroidales bacterium]|nr:LytTR family DNA-binding domain-containing protein [Bacteroidales bacterium]MDE7126467.1 LytTR family DNA-binding domain-containing protein [Bacteroidales bacterium]